MPRISVETAVFVGFLIGVAADLRLRPRVVLALLERGLRAREAERVTLAAAILTAILTTVAASVLMPLQSALVGCLSAFLTYDIILPALGRWLARRRHRAK